MRHIEGVYDYIKDGMRRIAPLVNLLRERLDDPAVTHTGYLGPEPHDGKTLMFAELTLGEQGLIEREFDPTRDFCEMDTIARIFPDRLTPYDSTQE